MSVAILLVKYVKVYLLKSQFMTKINQTTSNFFPYPQMLFAWPTRRWSNWNWTQILTFFFKVRSWITQFSIIPLLAQSVLVDQLTRPYHTKPGSISSLTNSVNLIFIRNRPDLRLFWLLCLVSFYSA